jgi:hypothetical protein
MMDLMALYRRNVLGVRAEPTNQVAEIRYFFVLDRFDSRSAVTLNTVRRLRHVLQPFHWNVNAAAGALPVCAVVNPYQSSTHASRLSLDVAATVFSHLMLLQLVHKSETADCAVHFRASVLAIQLFKTACQISIQLLKFSFH